MKKLLLIISVLCLVLAAGAVFGEEYTINTTGWGSDPDSLINALDPENAPIPIVPHKGLLGLTEEGLPGARGYAAGGPSETRDSLVNYLDPSFEPGMPKKLKTGVLLFDPDSMVHQISPVE